MSSHTPGPWKLKRSGAISDADGELVATTGYRVRVGSDEDDANARLIAAAPELLALLTELIDIEGPQPGHIEWANKVKAAIAKATA